MVRASYGAQLSDVFLSIFKIQLNVIFLYNNSAIYCGFILVDPNSRSRALIPQIVIHDVMNNLWKAHNTARILFH